MEGLIVESIQVPSGAKYKNLDLRILTAMHKCGFVRYSENPFTLKSGIQSNVYVYGREDLTDHPDMEWLVGEKIAGMLTECFSENQDTLANKQACLIGIPTAGTPFAQATAMVSLTNHALRPNAKLICHRLMKEQPKEHGAHKGWLNGKPQPYHSYWLVDNVATNGASKPEARQKMLADDYPNPDGAIIWIDRQQGATTILQEQSFNNILVAYNLLDISYAFGELNFWPKSVVQAVEKEIAAHQF